MATIDITTQSGAVGNGDLQLQNGAPMDSTLRFVTDAVNTASPLKLSTSLVQTTSTLKITTNDNPYIDAEDGTGNNRFTIGRDSASQQVNVDFASNPTGSTTTVGAIRTYVDGVNLSEVITFREDGRIQIGSTAASAAYWDNTNNRLGIGTNTPNTSIETTGGFRMSGSGSQTFEFSNATLAQFRAIFGGFSFRSSTGVYISNGDAVPTATLHVKGSGSTFATTSFLVQNSSGTAALTIKDDLEITMPGITNIQNYQFVSGNVITSSAMRLTTTSGGVAINTSYSSADASAQLDVASTTKGFLPPRMTNAQRAAIATPAVGLMVYCTDAVEGLYVYKSTGWTFVI